MRPVALFLVCAFLVGCAGNAVPSVSEQQQAYMGATVTQDMMTVAEEMNIETAYLDAHPALKAQVAAFRTKLQRIAPMDCNNAMPASANRRTPQYTNCPNPPPPNPYQNWQMQIESVNTYTMSGFGPYSMSDYPWPSPYRVWPRVASMLACINIGTTAQLVADGALLVQGLVMFPRIWASIGALPVVQSQLNLVRAGFMGLGAFAIAVLSEIPVGTIVTILGAVAITAAGATLMIQQMLSIGNCLVHGDLKA